MSKTKFLGLCGLHWSLDFLGSETCKNSGAPPVTPCDIFLTGSEPSKQRSPLAKHPSFCLLSTAHSDVEEQWGAERNGKR